MCHVLIIEDDAIAALDIRETLQAAGATSFDFASTEREAVACAHQTHPGLITADVMLGSGSGPSAVRSIEAELGPLPVIFVTATPDQCDGGGDAHQVVEKPFSSARLSALFTALAPL